MASFTVAPYRPGAKRLDEQLDDFARTIRHRQQLARKLGGYVRTVARRNVRRQRTVSGEAFAPRKRQRDQRRMLQGLAQSLTVISRASEGGVVVSWRNPLEAHIAARHQFGIGERWTPRRAAAAYGIPDYKAPCTRRQARALIAAGFRLPVPGPRGVRAFKRVSVQWLEAHFSLGHAGLVLRIMRTGRHQGRQTWRDTVPVRDFLGITSADADKMCVRIINTVLARKAK